MFIFQMRRTPLIAACERGHSATVQMLIDKGADLSSHVRPHNIIFQSVTRVNLMYVHHGVIVL